MSGPHDLRIGTSGWMYRHWRGVLYERGLAEGKWLERYAESFDTVELNASFYRLPPVAQFKSWRERTPERFRFSVKGSRIVTHVRRLEGVREEAERFFENSGALGAKGPVTLWQLPPQLEKDLGRLEGFTDCLPRGPGRRQAFEFRHPSWYDDLVYGLLERTGVALVFPDSAARGAMNAREHRHTADFDYLRLHYGKGKGGDYAEAELRGWAERIAEWRKERDVFVFFNNDRGGRAVRNAVRLKEILASAD